MKTKKIISFLLIVVMMAVIMPAEALALPARTAHSGSSDHEGRAVLWMDATYPADGTPSGSVYFHNGGIFEKNDSSDVLSGSGTAEAPYQIDTYDKLLQFSALVNEGATGVWAVLTGDITADEREWIPIGSSANKYYGTFDGMGHKIKMLALPQDNQYVDCGLFGYVDKDGRVKNVGLEECSFKGSSWVGSVAGRNKGKLENCYSVAAVIGYMGAETGGVVGRNYGTVENCYSYSGALHYGPGGLGGVAGTNHEGGVLKNCFSCLGAGRLAADAKAGGVVDMNAGTVDKCYYPVTDPVIQGVVTGTGDVKALSPEEFRDQTIFSDWNFDNVWYMDKQAGYPKLRAFVIEISDWAGLAAALKNGGSLALNSDLKHDGINDPVLTVPDGVSVTLDLNGHIINRNASEPTPDGYVIKVNGKLNLTDSAPEADHDPPVYYLDPANGKQVTVKGGIITGGWTDTSGGGVTVEAGVMIMKGGSIAVNRSGSTATGESSGRGAGVNINGGSFTMTGGAICGNVAAYHGGAIYNQDGSLVMTGGAICGNTAGEKGGAICSFGDLDVQGAMFFRNKANDCIIYLDYMHKFRINNNAFLENDMTPCLFSGNFPDYEYSRFEDPLVQYGSNPSLEKVRFLDNNWYGHFAGNGTTKPANLGDIKIQNWYYLKPVREIDTNGQYVLKVTPYLFNDTLKSEMEITPDKYMLPDITLDCIGTGAEFEDCAAISLTKGSFSPASFAVKPQNDAYTYQVGVQYPGTQLNETLSFERTLTVNGGKEIAYDSAEEYGIAAFENGEAIPATVIRGKTVTVSIGSNSYAATVSDSGTFKPDSMNETPGVHDALFTVEGFKPVTELVNMPKIISSMTLTANDAYPGKEAVIKAELPENASGKVTFTVDNGSYPVDIKDGLAILTIPGLNPGLYNVTASYPGDDNYTPCANETVLTVLSAPANHSIQVIGGKANVETAQEGDTVTITADMPQAGYGFVKWAEVEGVQFANAGSYTTTFVMPDEDVTLTAVLGKLTIPDIGDQTYTGAPIELTFAPSDVKLEGVNRDLVQGIDYELSYKDNVCAAGAPEVTLTLKAPLLGSVSGGFNIEEADISTAEVSFSNLITKQIPVDVEVTVTWNGKTLKNGEDYSVEGYGLTGLVYGNYSVEIFGIGNFKNHKSVDFIIDDVLNYDVEIYPGANMTKAADSGEAYQKYYIDEAAIESVVFTANEGWYFPEDYAVASDNGVSVTRNSFTQITVSGKPTGEVQIILPSPTAKAKEPAPTAVFTATGADTGTLSNVAAGMKYKIDNGDWLTISGTSVDLTNLAPCTITVYMPGNGTTTIDSDAQTITVTKAATPDLTATQLTTAGGTGSIPTTAEHEFSADGTSWTPCAGETTGLVPNTYYVRVKATGTALSSEAQEIIIIAPGSLAFYGSVTLNGRALADGDVFSFEVFENDVCVATGQNDASGEVRYTELNYFFSDVGEHVYTVKQRATTIPGVAIDTREYTVSVIVSCTPGDSALTITPGEEFSGLYFTNTYDKQTPPEYSVPTGLKAIYGQTLADVALPDGWTWDDPLTTSVGNVGDNNFSATFTPEDTVNYTNVTESLSVAVSQAAPDRTTPDGLAAVYGQTLADVALPDGWAWDDPLTTSVGNVGDNNFSATFTPEDTVNYTNVTESLTVAVAKKKTEYADLTGNEKVKAVGDLVENRSEQTLVTAPEKLPEGYTGVEYSTDGVNWSNTIPTGKEAGDYAVRIRYTGDANHESFEGDAITVTIVKAVYVLTDGGEPAYTKGSGEQLTLTVTQTGAEDQSYDNFAGVFIGETELRKGEDFTVVKGSTVVTILPAAFEKLDAGEYTLIISFTNGEASTKLTIREADAEDPDSPPTGDSSHTGLLVAIMILSEFAAISLLITGKRKKSLR